MDFARTILDLPVPRVLAWNARADPATNPVGAEYILMEKAKGDVLHTRWDDVKGEAARGVIEQTMAIEQRFAFGAFSQIGSLYYKEDVDEALQTRPLYAGGNDGPDQDKYRIGPLVDWDVWRGSRAALNVNRGPCESNFVLFSE